MANQRTDWEELARRQPYFRVLTDDGLVQVESNDVATAAFMKTGEADIDGLLSAIASVIGHEVSLASVLDFGCGVGRLTLPLARRAGTIVACDIAPTMLDHVRRNADAAGLHNVTTAENEQLTMMSDATFTFVCSLLVFQYIPRSSGYAILRTLLRLLAPGGIAVLHLILAPRGEALRQLARVHHGRSRVDMERGDVADGLQLYQYDERVIVRDVAAANARVIGQLATHGDNAVGAVLIIQKM